MYHSMQNPGNRMVNCISLTEKIDGLNRSFHIRWKHSILYSLFIPNLIQKKNETDYSVTMHTERKREEVSATLKQEEPVNLTAN